MVANGKLESTKERNCMSKIQFDAYLFFTSNKCKEAMEFYKSVFGGELTMQTYGKGMPAEMMSGEMKAHNDKIMHSLLSGGDIRLMASDSTRDTEFGQSFISLSLSGEDEDKLKSLWDKLAETGEITMPLEKAPWGDTFGSVTDKFGIEWMMNINAVKE